MKTFLTSFGIILPFIVLSQDLISNNFPTKDGFIHYTEVIHVNDSLNANGLYLNAKKWLANSFKTAKATIETDDKDAKLIILKSFIPKGHNTFISNAKNWFTLIIEMKDGRYRYQLYDIRYEFDVDVMGQKSHTDQPFEEWMKPSNNSAMSEKKRQKVNEALTTYCKQLDAEFKKLINSLKSGMNKIDNSQW